MGNDLVDVMREALQYRYTDAEQEASRSRESRIPDRLRPHRERVVAELAARAASGDRLAAPRIRVIANEARTHFLKFQRDSDIDWSDALCILIAVNAISDTEAAELSTELDESRQHFVLSQRVLSAAENGDIEHAAELAASLPSAYAHLGFRHIGRVAAKNGDAELYFRYAKKYAGNKDKNSLDRLRDYLLEGVQRVHGWDAAVEVARDPRVGVGHLNTVLWLQAHSGDLGGVDAALAGPLRGLLTPYAEMHTLMTAIARSSPSRPETDHPRLGELLDRVIAIDPTESKEVSRSRDGILFASWPAIGEEATLKRVRAALRTPNYKRELSVLAKDIPVR